jgi:hypothetical protein
MRQAQHPLTDWHIGPDVIDQMRSPLRHVPATTARAEPAALAREGDQSNRARTRRTESERSLRPGSRTAGSHETLARQTSAARRHPAARRLGRGRSRNAPGRSRRGQSKWDRPAQRWSMAAPRAMERRSSCHCSRPVNPTRIAPGVGERATADNRRCRRLRAGLGESGASGPVFGVLARSATRDALSNSSCPPRHDDSRPRVTPCPPCETVPSTNTPLCDARSGAAGSADRAAPSNQARCVSRMAVCKSKCHARCGSGVKGGEAAEGRPLTPLSTVV